MDGLKPVMIRLTPDELSDLDEIRTSLTERQGGCRTVPRATAALVALRWYAAELRRRRRKAQGTQA